jgi:hypothetical protein
LAKEIATRWVLSGMIHFWVSVDFRSKTVGPREWRPNLYFGKGHSCAALGDPNMKSSEEIHIATQRSQTGTLTIPTRIHSYIAKVAESLRDFAHTYLPSRNQPLYWCSRMGDQGKV